MINLESWQLLILFFFPLVILLAAGLPIAFVLGGLSVFLIWILMGPSALPLIAHTAISQTTGFVLLAIPLFVLMANLLGLTGIADDMFEAVYRWFGRMRGGLAVGVVIICTVFAAMAGISSVATVSMGLIALPAMLKRNYNKDIAIGSIAAGGALGILIPPSIIMIIYGSLCDESIGQLFMGGIIPGIILASIFIIYIVVRCALQPHLGPGVEEAFSFMEKMRSLKGVLLPFLLIVFILGAIYTGICTPTEAAAIGAVGALICALIKRKLNWSNLNQALLGTLKLSVMVFWIMIGATCFSQIYAISGLTAWATEIVTSLGVSRWAILTIMQFIFLILGMFLDPAGIIMICTPIFIPIIVALGFDTLWFGILFVINMEMAYITPPFGFNLFFMRGIVPPEVSMGDIYRSITPFVFLQALCLALVMAFPQLALWIPSTMVGR